MEAHHRFMGNAPRHCRLWLIVFLAGAGIAGREPTAEDAKALIPWKELDEKTRARLEEVVNQPTVYYRAPAEVFACGSDLYLLLLHEPVLTLELWKSFGASGAALQQVRPGVFEGSDGYGSTGRWEFVYKSPELHVIYSEGQYRGPLLASTLDTRSVLVLRTAYFEERDGRKYVKHQVDGFVRAESGSLKPLAKALRPIFQKSVEATVQEAVWFVSLMCRYTLYDPHSIAHALEHIDRLDAPLKARMAGVLRPLVASVSEKKSSTDPGDRAPNGD